MNAAVTQRLHIQHVNTLKFNVGLYETWFNPKLKSSRIYKAWNIRWKKCKCKKGERGQWEQQFFLLYLHFFFIKTFYVIVYLYCVQFLIPWLNKM